MASDVAVAVGVLIDDESRVLITRRADDAHQGGLWEFPGGKIESGESVHQALARELAEELGAKVEQSKFLLEIVHDYGDKRVRLLVHLVTAWCGEPYGAEGQPLAWVNVSGLERYRFPDANAAIVECLQRLC
ncbi:MAG: 8-oxo-dGTP diphosphatase MutT [Halieaceae bacterium]|jgi:8-oxo-dGTP diphosphatase|nr:8-oxo-dGTP diphosphatase MutT [Halieaceae bacterium]